MNFVSLPSTSDHSKHQGQHYRNRHQERQNEEAHQHEYQKKDAVAHKIENAMRGSTKTEHNYRDLWLVEFFSRARVLVVLACASGFKAVGYDKEVDENGEDIFTETGIAYVWKLAARLKPGGLAWISPECWTWLRLTKSVNMKKHINTNTMRMP